ncbi:Transposase [Pirellulimonas nuda]|uniref:Transposase n=1 Tax=Pirellulimonas nuda TaxID=2528009 RepID=A0A518DBT1_9BACT|nr:transposase [Pirellulimonas nuda]QDU88944.1 Transposase [Pirellulimonas nuda]
MRGVRTGSGKRERRHFTGAQKGAIVKAHLVDGVAISELCDKHGIQPTQFYLWQKHLFENCGVAFERKAKP